MWVPVHTEPLHGNPYDPARWRGGFIPLIGTAAVAADRGVGSYVLRLAADQGMPSRVASRLFQSLVQRIAE